MTIRSIKNIWFDDAATSAMGEAFDRACKSLQDFGSAVPAIVANLIITAAKNGERDPGRLYKQVLATMASKIRRCRLSARAAQSLPTLRSRAGRNQTPGVFTRVGLPSYLAWYTWRRVSLQAERADLPMTIRRRSNFEARQLVLFGAATIVLLVFTWTYVH